MDAIAALEQRCEALQRRAEQLSRPPKSPEGPPSAVLMSSAGVSSVGRAGSLRSNGVCAPAADVNECPTPGTPLCRPETLSPAAASASRQAVRATPPAPTSPTVARRPTGSLASDVPSPPPSPIPASERGFSPLAVEDAPLSFTAVLHLLEGERKDLLQRLRLVESHIDVYRSQLGRPSALEVTQKGVGKGSGSAGPAAKQARPVQSSTAAAMPLLRRGVRRARERPLADVEPNSFASATGPCTDSPEVRLPLKRIAKSNFALTSCSPPSTRPDARDRHTWPNNPHRW